MKLSIIIPNYNGCKFLPACLNSLKQQTFQDFQIILVDNGSSDDSIRMLSADYPEVKIIRFAHNQGFAAASNAGILASQTPYVMLLNNDTTLAPDCIGHLMECISKHPAAFSVGANILTMKQPHKSDTTGDYYTVFGYAFCRDQGHSPRFRKCEQVFTNCGCAVIYRKTLLQKTGLFDSRFFAYLEDVDLGIQARRLGYQNLHCPKAIVYHYGSGTTGHKYSEFKVFHSARNNIWLQRKNFSLFQRILHAPFTFCGMFLKYFYFCRYGLHTAYLKGCLCGLRPIKIQSKPSVKSYFRTEPWIIYGSFLYTFQYIHRKLTF